MARKRAACVIGWPVEHSRSPLIHNHWISRLGLDAEYRREAVPPDRFADFVSKLNEHGYVGANVTIPNKEAALALSRPDERAKRVGAANTLWLDGETLRSTNTDVQGFLDNLDASAPGWDGDLRTAVVIGAGGTARAVVHGLAERGVARIVVVNRSLDRARTLRDLFGERVHPRPWDERDGALAGAGLLVNTTSLGMTGNPPLSVDLAGLKKGAVVADVVYAPLVTPLLGDARAQGMRAVDGLGMLLYQAVDGFERWFGIRPKVTAELRALVEADLVRSKTS
jgi:shikimate dehydrogenase